MYKGKLTGMPNSEKGSEESVLTPGDVARLKGVTRSAVYAAVAEGRLPHVRLLGHIGIPASAARLWRPVRSPGRPPGIPMSAASRKRIASSQKQRWLRRKGK